MVRVKARVPFCTGREVVPASLGRLSGMQGGMQDPAEPYDDQHAQEASRAPCIVEDMPLTATRGEETHRLSPFTRCISSWTGPMTRRDENYIYGAAAPVKV